MQFLIITKYLYQNYLLLNKKIYNGGEPMSKSPLRLEQFDTVLYNANLNPMGVPASVIKALDDNKCFFFRYL
mgnify:CR=1 FL=1